MRIARAVERKVIFDIHYRPNLWGLAGHCAGEERHVKSDQVSKQGNRLKLCVTIVRKAEFVAIL